MDINTIVTDLAQSLAQRNLRVVFAESCTAGLVSATLSRVPGISEYLCGSAVVYRDQTKQDWLSVAEADIERETSVSETVARQMAIGVMKKTSEADYAVSITGHVGPDAPADLDGVVFIGLAHRSGGGVPVNSVQRLKLTSQTRHERQMEAVGIVLQFLLERVNSHSSTTVPHAGNGEAHVEASFDEITVM